MGKIRKPRKADIQNEQIADQSVIPPVGNHADVAMPTDEQVAQEVDALAEVQLPSKKRIWEVDFLRGFMILFVIWDHFMCYVDMFGASSGEFAYKTKLFAWLYELSGKYYASNGIRSLTQPVFVSMFVFTAGISCSLSKSNGKRALKMICFAMLISAFTFAISSIFGISMTINFNVIHVVALSVLLWTCLEWIYSKLTKDWQRNLYGWIMFAIIITILIVGYMAQRNPWDGEKSKLYFLVEHIGGNANAFEGNADYLPFFPDFGWFLVGAFLGKKLYKERQTLFPSFNAKWVSPFTFCGKYSIWMYLISAVVMYGFIYLFAEVLNVL